MRVFKHLLPGDPHYVTTLPFPDNKERARLCLVGEKYDNTARSYIYRCHRLNNQLNDLDPEKDDFYMDEEDFLHDYTELL